MFEFKSITTPLLLLAFFTARIFYQMVQPDGQSIPSVIQQVLIYYNRPHDFFSELPTTAIESRAAWKGPAFALEEDKWKYWLTEEEVGDALKAVAKCSSRNISLNALKRVDFPLPSWSNKIATWRRELNPKYGTGVVVIKNVPIRQWNAKENEIFWWGLGQHLGIPGAQNGKGDLLGHVKNEFYDGTKSHGTVRQYRTTEAIGFHCDTADVVGLYCVKAAAGKGEGVSRIVSSVSVFNELLRIAPDLVPLLFQKVPFDSRGEAGVTWFPLRPARFYGGVLRTFWHTEYMRSAYKYADVGEISPDISRLISTFDSIATNPEFYMEMEFEEGDVQLLSNHVVMHGRTAFVDDDPTGQTGRHVLRLWLSLGEKARDKEALELTSALASSSEFILTLAWVKLRALLF